jgi:hypothetical protein
MSAALVPAEKLILDEETRLAHLVAEYALGKPKLSIWMILLPLMIVFYMQAYQRYARARDTFVEETLKSRKAALKLARRALAAGRPVDCHAHLEEIPLTGEECDSYGEWIEALAEHYRDLLAAGPAASFAELVRRAYRSRVEFKMTVDAVERLADLMDGVLLTRLNEEHDEAREAVEKIHESRHELMNRQIESVWGGA